MKFEYKLLENPVEEDINKCAALGYRVIAVVFNTGWEKIEVYMERIVPAEVVEEECFELVRHDEPNR